MDVRVLGPVEVHDAHDLAIGGAQHRRIIAALAMRPGEVISVDRLVDIMWSDDDMPRQPERNLRTYVSRIRSSLGPELAPRLATAAPGYALHLEPDELDAEAFEHACAASVRALEQGDLELGLEYVEAASRLWRGRPYAEFADEAWARSEVARLEELRVAALERRADAVIALGRPGQAVAELEALIVEYPLRERPRALYMRALDAGGRQAEALRVFRTFRKLLVDEFGIGPTDDLVELDRRIARGDVAPAPRVNVRGYERFELIGSGAFADVFRGTQASLGRDVAIKAVRAELANRPEFIRGFEAEAAMVARLEHPHIVPLYDFWREPDRAYLVMRWLTGGSLETRLDDGPLALDHIVRMVEQVGSALAAAHRAGVVHRDVKSANILLDDDDNTYLSDFGIAVDATATVNPLAALSEGSPAFAAPEQLRRADVGPAADQFGLGIAAYEALVGRLPFAEAPDRATLLHRQLHEPLPAASSGRAELSSAVDQVLAVATAKHPEARYGSVGEFVEAFAAAVGEAPTVSSELRALTRQVTAFTVPVDNPYQGLRGFAEGDAMHFHGRTRLVDELVATLSGGRERLVAVVGPSGSGKSSAVAAGLLPALRRGRVDGSEEWFITSMTPGSSPYESLEAALLRIAVNPPASLLEQLRAEQRGILRGVRRILPGDGESVLLVIDQFEELFTLCDEEAERARFLEALAVAVTDPNSPVRVILTLRADFYDQPLRYQRFADLMKRCAVTVTPLMPDELEQAIVGPAHAVGVEFEPGLVATIVGDVGSRAGALPLMQYALTQVYEHRISGMMMLSTYRDIGGLTGALGQRAEALYTELDPAERSAAQRLFGRLVALGDGTDDTGRTVPRPSSAMDRATDTVVERFGAARMLTFDRAPTSREPTIGLAHDALISAWPRLRGWLDDDRESLTLRRTITEAAERWHDGGQAETDLLAGGRLESAVGLRDEGGDHLDEAERDYVDRSERRALADRARRIRRARAMRFALVVTSICLVVAIVSGLIAVGQRSRADERADDALRAEAEAEASEQAALAAEAAAESDREAALQAQSQAEVDRQAAVDSAEALDGELLRARAVAQASSDPGLGTLLALEAHRREPGSASLDAVVRSMTALTDWVASIPASWAEPVSSMAAILTVEDGEFVLRSEDDVGAVVARIPMPSDVIGSPSVAPDGRRATFVAGTQLHVVDLATGAMVDTADIPGDLPSGTWSLAWTDDSQHVLLPLASPTRLAAFSAGPERVAFEFAVDFGDPGDPIDAVWLDHHTSLPRLAVGWGSTAAVLSTASLSEGTMPIVDEIEVDDRIPLALPSWGAGDTLYVPTNGAYFELSGGEATRFESPSEVNVVTVDELSDGTLLVSGRQGAARVDRGSREVIDGPWPGSGTLQIHPVEVSGGLAVVNQPLSVGDPAEQVTVWSTSDFHPLDTKPPVPLPDGIDPTKLYFVPDAGLVGEAPGPQGPPVRIGSGELVDYRVENIFDVEPQPTADGWVAVVVTMDLSVSVHDLESGDLLRGPFVVDAMPQSVFVTHDGRHVVLWDDRGISARDADTGVEVDRIDHGGQFTSWVWLSRGPGPGIVTDVSGASVVFDTETFEVLAEDVEVGSLSVFDPSGDRIASNVGGSMVVRDWRTGEVDWAIPNDAALLPAFDATGDYLFGYGPGFQVWDAATGEAIGPLLDGPAGAFWDWELAHQVRGDGVHVIDTDVSSWLDRACDFAGRELTAEEWDEFVPGDEPYEPLCPA